METARFNGFTPKAVNWYFGIRKDYIWVRPELTHNIDKGDIMAGFRLDGLVLGSENLPTNHLLQSGLGSDRLAGK